MIILPRILMNALNGRCTARVFASSPCLSLVSFIWPLIPMGHRMETLRRIPVQFVQIQIHALNASYSSRVTEALHTGSPQESARSTGLSCAFCNGSLLKMFSSLYLAVVTAFGALLLAPDATAFVGGPTAFMGTSTYVLGAKRAVNGVLKMTEEAEEASTGPTAAEISKGIAHPEAVFTVPENILKVLPHRYPLALVDKVLHFEPGKRIVGVKCITNNEPQFTGHFPDNPIMPGVLQVEAMAQLGGLICLQEPCSDGQGTFFFAGVDGVKWRKPVVPGDVLVMEMELAKWKPKFGLAKMTGKGYVDGVLAVEVREFTFALAK